MRHATVKIGKNKNFDPRIFKNSDLSAYGESFNLRQEINNICQSATTPSILKKINELEALISDSNESVVRTIESESSLFVDLSQCISSYEREFAELPQKIDDLILLTKNVATFPAPTTTLSKNLPVAENEEILNQPAWITDAPLMFDCYIQQHRISEAIDLVVRCKNFSKNSNPVINKWIESTRITLKNDIIERVSSQNLHVKATKKGFRQLMSLGFEADSVDLYIKLSSKSVDNMLITIPSNTALSIFAKKHTTALCDEIISCYNDFCELFPKNYMSLFVSWIYEQLSTKLTICRKEKYFGNISLARESIQAMQDCCKVLETIGFSTDSIFTNIPKHVSAIIENLMNQNHIKESLRYLKNEEWRANLTNIENLKPNDYPLVPSLEKFKSNLQYFLQEIGHLYYSQIFADICRYLKTFLLSYGKGCLSIIEEQDISSEVFCIIIIQMDFIRQVIIPETSVTFSKVTPYEFPEKASIESEYQSFIDVALNKLITIFVDYWSNEFYYPDLFDEEEDNEWYSTSEISSGFESALSLLTNIPAQLTIPKELYEKACTILIKGIIDVSKKIASNIFDAKMFNSFLFHWGLVSSVLSRCLSRSLMDKFHQQINEVQNDICRENQINNSECMSTLDVQKAIKEFQSR